MPLDLDEYYVNNLLFSNKLQAFISINRTLFYIVIENDDLKILTNEQLPFSSILKFDFLTFTNHKFELNVQNSNQINTFTENGIELYEYKGNERTFLNIIFYLDLIHNRTINFDMINFMQLVSITDLTSEYVTITFFSPFITFNYKQTVSNLMNLAKIDQKSTINLKDSDKVTEHDFKLLKCFYDFRNDKIQGRLPSRDADDNPAEFHEESNLSIYLTVFANLFGILLILCLINYNYAENHLERRERFKNKLFHNKFIRFLKIKKAQKFKPKSNQMRSNQMRSNRMRSNQIRSENRTSNSSYIDDNFKPYSNNLKVKENASGSYFDDKSEFEKNLSFKSYPVLKSNRSKSDRLLKSNRSSKSNFKNISNKSIKSTDIKIIKIRNFDSSKLIIGSSSGVKNKKVLTDLNESESIVHKSLI